MRNATARTTAKDGRRLRLRSPNGDAALLEWWEAARAERRWRADVLIVSTVECATFFFSSRGLILGSVAVLYRIVSLAQAGSTGIV
jgi:hypothetical protein